VEAKQRPFEYWVDHRFALHSNPWGSPRILAQPPFVLREPKAAPIPERFNNREIKKGNLSYLAMIERSAIVNAKQERKHSNK